MKKLTAILITICVTGEARIPQDVGRIALREAREHNGFRREFQRNYDVIERLRVLERAERLTQAENAEYRDLLMDLQTIVDRPDDALHKNGCLYLRQGGAAKRIVEGRVNRDNAEKNPYYMAVFVVGGVVVAALVIDAVVNGKKSFVGKLLCKQETCADEVLVLNAG